MCAQKGGVGKTTLACVFASESLARGASVMLVDADPQGSARTWASIALDLGYPAPDVIAMGATMHRRDQLRRISAGYDVVVIDTPPRHSPTLKSALLCADLAVLPCGPVAMDAWALASTIDCVHDIQHERELAARICITRTVAGTTTLRTPRPGLEASGVPVLRSEFGFRVAYAEAMGAGRGVGQYAPSSTAAGETKAFADELWEILDETDRRTAHTANRQKTAARSA